MTTHKAQSPKWAPKVGVVFAALTLVFFMVLVILTIETGLPLSAKFPVISVLALGLASSFAFIGGDAAASGRLPLPGIESHPIIFSIGGGVAVFFLVFILGNLLYPDQIKTGKVKLSNVGYYRHEYAANTTWEKYDPKAHGNDEIFWIGARAKANAEVFIDKISIAHFDFDSFFVGYEEQSIESEYLLGSSKAKWIAVQFNKEQWGQLKEAIASGARMEVHKVDGSTVGSASLPDLTF